MHITPDSIPSSEQVRDTLLDRVYYPYQKQILGGAAILIAAIVTILGVRQWRENYENDMWSRFYALQESPATSPEQFAEQAASLAALAAEFPAETLTPHALRERVFALAQAKQWDEALAALDELSDRYPDDDFFRIARGNPDGKQGTLADWLQDNIERERTWEQQSAYQHHWPSDSRLALVETTSGSFWMGFYEVEAPNHVASFVQRAKDGKFNGTQVYVARKDTAGAGHSFSVGTSASKTHPTEPWKHDESDPVLTQEPEASRFKIRHQRRIVTSVATDSGNSGEAFMVIAALDGISRFDGESTPFGAVMEREGSLAVIDQLATASTYGSNPETKDLPGTIRVREHPYPALVVRRVTIWKDEKLEDGHQWDTARAASDQPEPWEADLAPAWKPEKAADPEKPDSPEKPDDGNDDASDE